jgi:EmrB/QacA subfamily drug resistance transporter
MFGLFLASFLLAVGRLTDRFGRKKFFLYGLFLWFVASLGAGLSINIYMLIFFRGLQGLSTAVILPVSQALIIMNYPKNEKNKATAIWAAVVAIGLALGPTAGGLIISVLSWRWIFFLGLPFTFFGFISTLFLISETKDESDIKKLDFKALCYLFFSLGFIIYGIVEIPTIGFWHLETLGCILIGIISLGLLIYFESRTPFPLIQFKLFLNREFLSGSLTNFIMIFTAWTTFFLIPIYLQTALLFTPLTTGLLMLTASMPMAFVSTMMGKIKTHPKKMILLGLVSMIVGIFIQTILPEKVSLWQVVFGAFFFGTGWGIAFGPSIAMGVTSLPPNMIVTASGAQTTFQEIGGCLGLAICGSLFRLFENISLTASLKKVDVSLTQSQIHQLHTLLTQSEQLIKALNSFHNKLSGFSIYLQKAISDGYKFAFFGNGILLVIVLIAISFMLKLKKP